MSIDTVLQMIDRYIDQLEEWEMEGAYKKNIKDFFSFVQEYGADRDDVITIIKTSLGYTPKEIHDRKQAEEIRELLRKTAMGECLGRRRDVASLSNPKKWAENNISFSFDQQDVDPDEEENGY